MTPTQRSLAMLRADGWTAEVVEHYNSFTRRRHDLFNIADIVALRGPDVLLVQTTSGSNVDARIKKIADAEHIGAVRAAGIAVHVHGWRKVKVKRGGKAMRWACRVVDVS